MPLHENKHCKRCDTNKSGEEFYKRRKGTDLSPYCKPCTIEQTVWRQREFKRLCVDYKGGKCMSCGYDKCIGALEFHHRDPSQKDFTFSGVKRTKMVENDRKELNKCDMLCANCHREVHSAL